MTYVKNKQLKTGLIVFYYGFACLFIVYGLLRDNLFKLNEVQLDRSGDGFKNFFTFAYHYRHGDGYWFDGMQYPYGDLVLYADGQTFFLFLFEALNSIGIDLSGKTLFVVQALPILSLFLAALLLHKIMRSFNQPRIWTMLTVSFCLALSPQLYKFNVHFALAYACYIPAIWYCLILYERKEIGDLFFSAIMSLTLLILAFIHPYIFAISLFFLLAYFSVQVLYRKTNWWLLASAVMPLFIFMFTVSALDPFIDRPLNPWGAWRTKTEIGDLFPFTGWFYDIFGSSLDLVSEYREGYCYTGILFLLFPLMFIRSKFKIDWQSNFIKYFYAAFIVLLFALGVHLLLTNHEISNWIPKLRQFRAIGRFSLPFYYVSFIGLSMYARNQIRKIKSKKISLLCYGLIVCFWFIDAYSYVDSFYEERRAFFSKNELETNQEILNIISKSEYQASDFQAVLPLPVPIEGAEKLYLKDDWAVKTRVMPYVFQSGTPMVGAYMSRVSLGNMLNQLQLSGSTFLNKKIVNDFSSTKDILIVINLADTTLYKDLLSSSYFIGETKSLQILGIDLNTLRKQERFTAANLFDSEPALYYDDFVESPSKGLMSEGSLIINGEGNKIQTLTDLDTIPSSLVFSFWFRIDQDKSSGPMTEIVFKDKEAQVISTVKVRDKTVKRMEVLNNWVQLKYTVEIPQTAYALDWNISAEHLHVDHALITRQDLNYSKALVDDYYIWNHFIGQSE